MITVRVRVRGEAEAERRRQTTICYEKNRTPLAITKTESEPPFFHGRGFSASPKNRKENRIKIRYYRAPVVRFVVRMYVYIYIYIYIHVISVYTYVATRTRSRCVSTVLVRYQILDLF